MLKAMQSLSRTARSRRRTASGTPSRSRALLGGESLDEVTFLLVHRDANATRAVYLWEERSDARRRTMRRSRMVAEFAAVLGSDELD